ncbi:ATP-binding protein [Prosthecobacter sp.]|uniref:ATP-binding protein n=1 Tax=Prosthecobacter sp. TaxID=1965333 RepID=UPI0037837460
MSDSVNPSSSHLGSPSSIQALQEHQLEIERLKRLYAALSQINHAIVRKPQREELFKKICTVLVGHGGFLMAWIGWNDPETKRLMPVAECGDTGGYLHNIQIYTDERPEGLGPSGTAFREGRPYICNDLLNDPSTLPWRAEAGRRNLHASAVFPIRQKGVVCGTLNVYAAEPGFFQDQEIALLEEAAMDVSFALENLEREALRQQAQEEAENERLFMETMIESMPGIVYFYSEQGKFLRWNQNFSTVSGYSSAEIAQMHPLDFFGDSHKTQVAHRIAQTFETGTSAVEAPFMCRDGSSRPYFFTGRRVVFKGTTCLVGMGIDISERHAAEQALQKSEQRYRSTLDNILEGCQLLDFEWRYLYLNDAASIQNRRPKAGLLGSRMQDAWPGIEQSRVFALIRRCLEERLPFHEETEFIFPDGERGWFDVRGQPVPEGVFLLSIDITERHQAEMALRELNDSLEAKVATRTTELEAARVRAEAADRLKSAFLATMSHELRTPLNSIIGFTGILLQGLAGPLNPEQGRQLGMVRTSARHLLELINDVLDLSKIEAGQLELRAIPFDLKGSIERVTATVRPQTEAKGLTLTTILPPELGSMVSDQRRVDQILLNLLNNAIKFTDQGHVTLTAEPVLEFQPAPDLPQQPAVRLSVTDTGIGIKPEDLSKLFQPFRQIDSGLTRQHEGTGLGLAICRRLTTLLGGEISAASEWTKGSTFSVILPLQAPA